jgi:SNF family Na+-dependent transporter
MKKKYKKILALGAMGMLTLQSNAQDLNKAFSAFDAVTNQLKANFGKVQALIFTIAAILFVVGLIQVIPKFQAGDPNATKHAVAWAGGVLVLIVGGMFIKTVNSFFEVL